VPHLRFFAILGTFIVPGAACQVGSSRVPVTHNCTIRDSVPRPHPYNAPTRLSGVQVLFPQETLPRSMGRSGTGRVLVIQCSYPGRGPTGQTRGFAGAKRGRRLSSRTRSIHQPCREQDDLVGIPCPKKYTKSGPLASSGGQSRAGAYPLHIPNHDRRFGVIPQAGVLGHQAQPGPEVEVIARSA